MQQKEHLNLVLENNFFYLLNKMGTYLEYSNSFNSTRQNLLQDFFYSIRNDPGFINDNQTINSGTLEKSITYTNNQSSIVITGFTIQTNNNIRLYQINGQTPLITSLDFEQILECYQQFSAITKIAKIVTLETSIRVVVNKDATDEEIKEKAFLKIKGRLSQEFDINSNLINKIFTIETDNQNPYNTGDIGND